jgi:TRAP-type C4-dicarboxylate transport system permease small subunit
LLLILIGTCFKKAAARMMRYTWWIFQLAMTLACVFFLVFGIDILKDAYRLKDPFSFIMTFFSASFIILFSITIAVICIIKMVRVYRKLENKQ